jgi:hypothetical protein
MKQHADLIDGSVDKMMEIVNQTAANEAIGFASVDFKKAMEYNKERVYFESMIGSTSDKKLNQIFNLQAMYYTQMQFYTLNLSDECLKIALNIKRKIKDLMNTPDQKNNGIF